MSLGNLKPEVQRALAIAIPSLGLLSAAVLIVPKAVGIHRIGLQVAACRQQVVVRQRENVWETARQKTPGLAARPQSRQEPLAFLRELNRIVVTSHAHLVSYRPAAGPAGAAPPAPAPAAVANNPSVLPIATEVTAAGSYTNLLGMFRSLARTQRLFAVENLRMKTEAYPRLSATFRLVRYVTPVNVAMAACPQAP